MAVLSEHWRRIRRDVLGLNRRNQEFMIRLNPAPLVALVDHKARTKERLSQYGLPAPETFGTYGRQRDLPALQREIEKRSSFVLKPARGAGGEGILVICERREGRLVKPSGKQLQLRDAVEHAADIIAGAFSLSQSRDDALIERRLVTDAALAAFSFGGVPDIRVVVVHGVPVMAMVRLPTSASDGRANLHMGGVGVGIELASGRAVHAIWNDTAIANHPDTRQSLAGLHIPHWPEVRLLAARSYEAIALGYFGIDVVIDRDAGPNILELNARPGLSIQLATQRGLRPYLQDLERRVHAKMTAADRVALGLEVEARVSRKH